ncbi:MAG: lytic transglycosylase domain-containing protein [Armatimonadetes bacterium]|nr:lytic transglycosylase domain-containing protein [Armatimonadota bacterium]
MDIDSVRNVESRIAEIEERIARLSGEEPSAAASPGAFASRFAAALGSSADTGAGARYQDIIAEAASRYDLDPALIHAVMMCESGGRANAVSSAGAQGLMQLMPATARSLGVDNPFDPQQSIMGGARYLRSLLDRLGSADLAVAAYNAGPGAVEKYGGIPPYAETRNYVAAVMARWKGGER